MKKLEPGMLCRVVHPRGKDSPNHGKIVTLDECVGSSPPLNPGIGWHWSGEWGFWWEIDAFLKTKSGMRIPYAQQDILQPINPDHQPADEEWQADFKRILSGQPATERKHA